MMRVLPVLLALFGLGAGLGAGLLLKPPEAAAPAEACAEGAGCETAAADDPFRSPPAGETLPAGEVTYVPLDKPFVVPIFSGERVVAMVVVSLSVATTLDGAPVVQAVQPRLRDNLLTALFRHANSGGFDGSFTAGQKMADLRAALVHAAREVVVDVPVGEVLITEIARQEV